MAGHEQPRRTQPGPGPKRATRRRGKLALLPTMPLDILYEILGTLPPLDLLHLGRTTKSFRAVLMRRTARHIWIRSLATVPGLPPCPPGLAEPRFVCLAFDARCSFCCAPNIRTVHWELRVRCCRRCLADEAKIVTDFHIFTSDYERKHDIMEAAAASVLARKDMRGRIYLRSDVDCVRDRLTSLEHDPLTKEAYLRERRARLVELGMQASSLQDWFSNRQ